MSARGLLHGQSGSSSSAHQWIPILDGAAHCAAAGPRTMIWPVGASASDLLVATLRVRPTPLFLLSLRSPGSLIPRLSTQKGITEPSVSNRPVLNGIPFAIPTLAGNPQGIVFEQRSLLNRVALTRLDALSQMGSVRQRRDYRQSALRLLADQDSTFVRLLSVRILSVIVFTS